MRAELVERYTAQNRECARIILGDSARYGGPGSLMVSWARVVLGIDSTEAQPQAGRLAA